MDASERLRTLTESQKLDCFFSDTFLPTTRRDQVMRFTDVEECYQQWCSTMGIAPTAGSVILSKAMQRRFQYVWNKGVRLWFIEILPHLLES